MVFGKGLSHKDTGAGGLAFSGGIGMVDTVGAISAGLAGELQKNIQIWV